MTHHHNPAPRETAEARNERLAQAARERREAAAPKVQVPSTLADDFLQASPRDRQVMAVREAVRIYEAAAASRDWHSALKAIEWLREQSTILPSVRGASVAPLDELEGAER